MTSNIHYFYPKNLRFNFDEIDLIECLSKFNVKTSDIVIYTNGYEDITKILIKNSEVKMYPINDINSSLISLDIKKNTEKNKSDLSEIIITSD